MTIFITQAIYHPLSVVFEMATECFESACEHDCENIWEAAYDFIFSEQISGTVCDLIPDFDWDDPDATYDEDVCAFMWAFNELMDNITIISE